MTRLGIRQCIRNGLVGRLSTRATPGCRFSDPTSDFFPFSFFLSNATHSRELFLPANFHIFFFVCDIFLGEKRTFPLLRWGFRFEWRSMPIVQTRFSLSISAPHRRTSRSIHSLRPKYGAGVTWSRVQQEVRSHSCHAPASPHHGAAPTQTKLHLSRTRRNTLDVPGPGPRWTRILSKVLLWFPAVREHVIYLWGWRLMTVRHVTRRRLMPYKTTITTRSLNHVDVAASSY